MVSRSKSLAAIAAVLAAGVTPGAFIPQAMSFQIPTNGLSINGVVAKASGSTGMPFDFSTVAVEDVQFPAVNRAGRHSN